MNVRRTTRAALLASVALARLQPRAANVLIGAASGTIGLAHGALDHLVPGRLALRPPGGALGVGTAYAALTAASFAAYVAKPRLGAVALAALGAVHFSCGDDAYADDRASGASGRLRTAARMCALVGLPLAFARLRPDAGRRTRGTARTAAVAVFAAITAAGALDAARRGYAEDALDIALPALLLLAAPPAFVFAAYFATWHSPRHVARLLDLDCETRGTAGRLARMVRDVAPTFGTAAAGAAFIALHPPHGLSREEAMLAGIFAVTVPHACIVRLMDDADRRKPAPEPLPRSLASGIAEAVSASPEQTPISDVVP